MHVVYISPHPIERSREIHEKSKIWLVLGYRMVALAARESLSRRDMAVAAELPLREVERIIAVFREHELMCKRNAVAERLRHQPSFV
jgi:hypothetical protein